MLKRNSTARNGESKNALAEMPEIPPPPPPAVPTLPTLPTNEIVPGRHSVVITLLKQALPAHISTTLSYEKLTNFGSLGIPSGPILLFLKRFCM